MSLHSTLHLKANECYGNFLLKQGDYAEGKYRMDSAIQLYEEWGAMTKVSRLQQSVKKQEQSPTNGYRADGSKVH